MPNRILRDWTDSENIDELDVHTERFFTRLIMKVDDFGRFSANIKLLKSQLFPLKSDIRETDISRWLTACDKSGLIALYNVANKEYLQIENFKQTLRQKKEKYPPPVICLADATQMLSTGMSETNRKESESETENETKTNISPTGDDIVSLYKKIEKTLKSVHDFIRDHKPEFIEPYFDLWNFFAIKYKMAQVTALNDNRKKKFNVRIREKNFDFIKIMAREVCNKHSILLIMDEVMSGFGRTGKWFGFDWILENDTNYLKVIEGSYDNKEKESPEALNGNSVNIKLKSVG